MDPYLNKCRSANCVFVKHDDEGRWLWLICYFVTAVPFVFSLDSKVIYCLQKAKSDNYFLGGWLSFISGIANQICHKIVCKARFQRSRCCVWLGEGGIRRTAVGKTHMLIVTIALDIITITTDLIFTINYQEYMNRWKIPRSKSALFTCVAQQTYVDWKKAWKF